MTHSVKECQRHCSRRGGEPDGDMPVGLYSKVYRRLFCGLESSSGLGENRCRGMGGGGGFGSHGSSVPCIAE